MLVVGEVLPEGPAQPLLEPGDILVRVEDNVVNSFLPVEASLDERVGEKLRVEIERQGEPQTLEIPVQDLHALSPSSYLEAGGAVFNTVSYHQARNHAVPARGVFVAGRGYMLGRAGVPRGAVVTHLDGQEVDTLESFEEILAAIPEGQKTPLRYFALQNPRAPKVATLEPSRRLFSMERCTRGRCQRPLALSHLCGGAGGAAPGGGNDAFVVEGKRSREGPGAVPGVWSGTTFRTPWTASTPRALWAQA